MNTLLIVDNINDFEKRNDTDDLKKVYKYPDFFKHQKNNSKSYIFSSNKKYKPIIIDNYVISKKEIDHKFLDEVLSYNDELVLLSLKISIEIHC